MRRTKIVCTIGPASESPKVVRALLAAGMNVARLNFSHGDLAEHEARIRVLRQESEKAGRGLGILQDIQGPKIRIGIVPGEKMTVKSGQDLTLCIAEDSGQGEIHVPYPGLVHAVHPGRVIFLDDGLIELLVTAVEGPRVHCSVTVGGDLKSRKGLTLPGVDVDLPPLTPADLEHIRFGIEQDVDFIAASFVREAAHVEAVRNAVHDAGGDVFIIAKIENQQGVGNIDEIIESADGIMVARGDLGVELPPEEVPIVQKAIIDKCNQAGKPVITATQMLDSMARNPRPTRAEVTDVANAIFDGTDAVMLSGETAVGLHPVETVQVMSRIAVRTEQALDYGAVLEGRPVSAGGNVAEAICRATCETAEALQASAVISSTQSGFTARMVSKFRPRAPIIAVTPHEKVMRQLSVTWGVHPLVVARTETTDAMIDEAIEGALKSGYVHQGERVVVTAGVRTGTPGSTNLLQVHTVGED